MRPPLVTPAEAIRELLAAGATFRAHRSASGLPTSFTYALRPGGDRERCRGIISEVKAKPPQFLSAFRQLVEQHVREAAQ